MLTHSYDCSLTYWYSKLCICVFHRYSKEPFTIVARSHATKMSCKRRKKYSYESHARSEVPVGELCAMICNRSCDMSWCVRCATKASVVRWSDSIVRVVRWSDDGTCVNAIRRTANVRSCEPWCVYSHLGDSSCSLIFSTCTREVLVQQHPWFSLESQVWSEK